MRTCVAMKNMIANTILPFWFYWEQCARLKPYARRLHMDFSLSWHLHVEFVRVIILSSHDYVLEFFYCFHFGYTLPICPPLCNCNDHWPFQVAREKTKEKNKLCQILCKDLKQHQQNAQTPKSRLTSYNFRFTFEHTISSLFQCVKNCIVF